MIEVKGNLFNQTQFEAIAFATNGFVSQKHGYGMYNVMGRGSAGEAKRRWPRIDRLVATTIREYGNYTNLLTQKDEEGRIRLEPVSYSSEVSHTPTPISAEADVVPYHILTFPTKPGMCERKDLLPHYAAKHPKTTKPFPGWMSQSKLDLIERSALDLVEHAKVHGWKKVGLPRPGCGAGALDWIKEVKPLLAKILDDRFYIVNF